MREGGKGRGRERGQKGGREREGGKKEERERDSDARASRPPPSMPQDVPLSRELGTNTPDSWLEPF